MAVEQQGGRRLDRIEMMRGVAALGVVFAHAVDTTRHMGDKLAGPFLPSMPLISNIGASGVDLFFVISGFVMAHLIAQAPPSPGLFLRRRIHRIMPMFLLCSAIYAALLSATGWRPTVAALANTLTLLPLVDGRVYSVPPLFVGWTLAFEAGFYLLVLLVLRSRVARPREALLMLTAGVAAAGMVLHPDWAAARVVLNPMMAEFALGVAAHLSWQRGLGGAPARQLLIVLVTGFLIADLVMPIDIGFSVHFAAAIDGAAGARRSVVWGLPWTLALLALLGPAARERTWQTGLRRIGSASYALYLTHPAVMLVVSGCIPAGSALDAGVVVAVQIAASLAVALVTHHLIERQLLRRWVPRSPQIAIA